MIIIAFDSDVLALNYLAANQIEWPLLIDRDRRLYKWYGMESAGWWALLNPVSILRYVTILFHGVKMGMPGEDVKQLGGDILIDPKGIVRMHYISQGPHDRPTPQQIFGEVKSSTAQTAN